MSTATTAVVKTADKPMEYTPYGSKDSIKLSINMVKDQIAVRSKSGQTCTDVDAMKFLMMCKARLLNPWEGDAFLIGYDGRDGTTFSLITAHQAFLKRAELNPEYDGMKSGIIVEQDGEMKDLEGDFFTTGQKVVGGWATVFFKNRKHPMHKRIRLSRFQKTWGIWQDDPAGMICKCAEADALRSSFPTMLGGLYLKEELNHDKDPKAAAPIFIEPSKEEPVIDVTPPPEIKVAEVPKEAPRPVKPPIQPVSFKSPVDVLKDRIATSGVPVKQIIDSLIELGVIDASVNTIEEIAIQSPDTLEMLDRELDDIVERIKS